MNTNGRYVVDFVPIIEGGDMKIIDETDYGEFNGIINTILIQLNMKSGTLDLYPTIGAKDHVEGIVFSNDPSEHISIIRSNINELHPNADVSFVLDSNNILNLYIELDNVPGRRFEGLLSDEDNKIRIVNPRIMEV